MLDEKLSADTLNSHTTQFVDKQCRPTTFGASSKNQFTRNEFSKKKLEYNRIRVTRFQQPGTRFQNRVISQLTMANTNSL